MSVYNEYGRSGIEQIQREYNKERIAGYIKGAEQDIEQIREYIHAAKNRLQMLEGVEYTRELVVSKGSTSNGYVEYGLGLWVIPNVSGERTGMGSWVELHESYPATPDPHELGALPGRETVLLRSTHLKTKYNARRIIRFKPTTREIREHGIAPEEVEA